MFINILKNKNKYWQEIRNKYKNLLLSKISI